MEFHEGIPILISRVQSPSVIREFESTTGIGREMRPLIENKKMNTGARVTSTTVNEIEDNDLMPPETVIGRSVFATESATIALRATGTIAGKSVTTDTAKKNTPMHSRDEAV